MLIRAHLLPLIKKSQQWLYYLYYPLLGFFIERGICTLLSTNGDFTVIVAHFHRLTKIQQRAVRSFYRENSTTTAANLFLLNGQYSLVQPIDSKNAERCICTILTIK